MPEPRIVLERQSVLDAGSRLAPAVRDEPFTLRMLPATSRYSLRLSNDVAERLSPIAGFEVRQTINSITGSDKLAMRLGPDEWLLAGGDAGIRDNITTALAGEHHALVDISHRQVAFEALGERAIDILNCGCPLDLHQSAFPAGSATRTLFGKAEIILSRQSEEPHWRIECWRSFGRYVDDYLMDAARLLGVAPNH